MDDYHVNLPDFHGPLDLLLHLVKRNEIDIRDIPIAIIIEQFRGFIDVLKFIDVDLAGDFLVTAAVLMEIKSKMLLPSPPEGVEAIIDDDPRTNLVNQLLDFKRYRESALRLEGRAAAQEHSLPRIQNSNLDQSEPSPGIQIVELWDLLSAFGRLINESTDATVDAVDDDTPQHVYREEIIQRVSQFGCLPFRDVFAAPFHRIRLVGLFLALLELIKSGLVQAQSPASVDDIWIALTHQTNRP